MAKDKKHQFNIKDLWDKRYPNLKPLFGLPGHWSAGLTEWSWNDLEQLKARVSDADDKADISLVQELLADQFEWTPGTVLKSTDFNPDVLSIEYIALKKILRLPGSVAKFQDNFTPVFNKENVYGRMDPIATYQGTGRTIDLTWAIDITSVKSETQGLLRAIGDLAKFMYPVYQDKYFNELGTGTLVAPPLLRFTLNNAMGQNLGLMKNTNASAERQRTPAGQVLGTGLLGIVDSFKYLTFVTGLQGGELNVTRLLDKDNQLKIVPTHVEVSFSITILHEEGKVGWVWRGDRDANSPEDETIVSTGGAPVAFAQGAGYPYGYGSTITLSNLEAAPVDPAASPATTGGSSIPSNLSLEMSDDYNEFMTSNPADILSGN